MLQIFDLNQGNLSRKVLAHKRNVDGFETPRNSLEFPNEAPPSFNIIQDDIPYSCQVRLQSSEVSIRPNGTDEEMLKRRNDKCNTPSIVARLMGLDNLPSEVKPMTDSKERTLLEKTKQELLPYATRRDFSLPTNSSSLTKPRSREHPQEEVLQKFKKEFAEWQASKVWEHSSSLREDNYLQQKNVSQILAQENLTKEKIARYCGPKTNAISTVEQRKDFEQLSVRKFEEKLDRASSSTRLRYENDIGKQSTKFEMEQDRSVSSTRIVILKPSSEQHDEAEQSWPHSPEMMEKEGSMQNFLEEVKERLKSEILGKSRNGTKARDIITEASFGERSPNTKQFARHVARKIRDSVTRDLKTTLIRSESTRSYRSKFQVEYPEFPEYINRDSRRLPSERMKNVVRNETVQEVPHLINERSRIKRIKSRSIHDFSILGKNMNYLEDKRTMFQSKASYIKGAMLDAESVSPRNLVRSFSAPVCGTSLGRLILEDQHVITGAHICRKHEAPEHPSQELKKKKKEVFNLKDTVSNFRHNFILKGKLFGKKTQFIDEVEDYGFNSLEPIVSPPSVVEKFRIVQDNSTEVPPSPASVSSCSQDDFFRQDHPSPVSPLEAPFVEHQSAPNLSKEISSRLSESRDLSEQVEHAGYEEVAVDEKSLEDETIDVECDAERYIRDILIAAGLYEADIFGESFPRWYASTKPISSWVFDEVDETYSKKGKFYDDILSRRMLFDLVNEALPSVLKAPTVSSRSNFKNWVLGPDTMPSGKKLLDGLWCHIRGFLDSSYDSSSTDDIVPDDVRIAPWCNVLHEDVDVIGRKLGSIILAELIGELIQEMR